MKFINEGEPTQVRQDEGIGRFRWRILKTGETIDLPLLVGKAYGFKVKSTEGKLGEKKVETKQLEVEIQDIFFKKLQKIKGIGKQTAKDIVNIFKTERQLRIHINNDDELPIRNDVEKLLRGAF